MTGASLERLALAPELAPPVSALALGNAARLRPVLGLRAPSLSAAPAGAARLPALWEPLPALPDLFALRRGALSGDLGVAKTSCTAYAQPYNVYQWQAWQLALDDHKHLSGIRYYILFPS